MSNAEVACGVVCAPVRYSTLDIAAGHARTHRTRPPGIDTMFDLILLMAANRLWYVLPLIVTVSLVYAATRHEETVAILRHAAQFAAWVTGFLVVILAIIMLVFR